MGQVQGGVSSCQVIYTFGERATSNYSFICIKTIFSETADEFDSVYKSFMKERSKIETEYALKLKRMIKAYTPKVNRKLNENDEEFSRTIAFR